MRKAEAVLATSAIVALALVVGGAPDPKKPSESPSSDTHKADVAKVAKEPVVDVVAYNERIKAVREANPMVVDLLSTVLQPGDGADVGANFPFGARLTGELELTTDGFTITKAECEDRPAAFDAGVGQTWCYVHVTNSGTEPSRAQLLVKYRLGD